MMQHWIRNLLVAIAIVIAPVCFASDITENQQWQHYFEQYQATGTIVIADGRTQSSNRLQAYNAERAKVRYAPASTFKIPHTLMALDSGAVIAGQHFKWDGAESAFALHNQDQTLESAMRYSVIWVYRQFATAIGKARAEQYLQQLQYGNANASTEQGDYWIDGELAISAVEQIGFLQQLYAETLPFKSQHQQLVKSLILNEQGEDWVLRAKTGWQGNYGWWVGWVELPDGPVFFALNIDTPNRLADLPKREQIGRAVLESLQVLPNKADKS